MTTKTKSYKEVKNELQNRYQAWKVIAVAGYVNDEKEKVAKDIIEKVALHYDFIPSYFATIVLTEGLGITYLDKPENYQTTPPFHIRNDIIVSGFESVGTDDFGSEFNRYKSYLPDDYNEGYSEEDLRNGAEFMKDIRINERNEQVVSAKFSNMESMIWACGATLAHRRDRFLKAVGELGYSKPTEDELAYWIYIYYQGEGQARRWLQ